jgi:hypothetical protein
LAAAATSINPPPVIVFIYKIDNIPFYIEPVIIITSVVWQNGAHSICSVFYLLKMKGGIYIYHIHQVSLSIEDGTGSLGFSIKRTMKPFILHPSPFFG